MGIRMQQRRGTSTEWQVANPVLANGEFGIETDTGVVKMGNGGDVWTDLAAILGSTYLPILGKAADSEKLDGHDSSEFLLTSDLAARSVNPAPDTVPVRTSDSRIKAADPTQSDDLTTRAYLEKFFNGVELGNAVDLDTITTPGTYTQSQTAEAATGTHYPVALAGLLEVRSNINAGTPATMVWQTYTPYGVNGTVLYKRSYYNITGWTAWTRYNSSAANMQHQQITSGSANTTSLTTYSRTSTDSGGTFVAPPSGLLTIILTIYLYSTSASVDANAGWQVNTGATVGAGTLVDSAYGLIRTRYTAWQRMGGAAICSGLTPGTTYNVFPVFASGTAGTVINASQSTLVLIPSP